jgi:hypothetical protein
MPGRRPEIEDLEIIIDVSAHKDRQELQSSIVTVKSLEVRAYDFFLIFRRVFVDVIISFQEALEVVEMELGFMYDTLYTKASIAHTWKGWVLRSICSACLVIFFLLDKPRHQVKHVDVGITYALLLGGLALDHAPRLQPRDGLPGAVHQAVGVAEPCGHSVAAAPQ